MIVRQGRRLTLVAIVAVATILTSLDSYGAAAAEPNVVVILADDMGRAKELTNRCQVRC